MDVDPEEPDMLHFVLSKLPKPFDLDALILKTVDLMNQYPPKSLPGPSWWLVSRHSVLKSVKGPESLSSQTFAQGECHFHKQTTETRVARACYRARLFLLKRRRGTTAVFVTILIGVLSWHMQTRRPSGLATSIVSQCKALHEWYLIG